MSKPMQVRNVNLNLFPVLLKLLRHRNVTQAASELHLTQQAVSGMLKRLREIFDDELLVSHGRDLLLTEKAKALLPLLEQLQSSAEAVVGESAFDPSTAKLRFRIATADWVNFLLIPPLSQRLRQCAPHVSVHFMQGEADTPKAMRQGFVDVLIGPEKVSDWTGLNLHSEDSDYSYQHVFQDRLVGIESTHSPVPDIDRDLNTYLRHTHLTFNFGPRIHASIERDALSDAGLTQNDQFLLPEFTTLPYLVAATGATAAVPLSIARQMTRILPLRAFEPPLEFAPLRLIMVWSKVRDNDQALKWFRQMLRDAFQEVTDNEAATAPLAARSAASSP